MIAPAANPAERLVVATIAATWALWLIGGLYLAGPLLGWALGGMAAWHWYVAPALPAADRPLSLPLARMPLSRMPLSRMPLVLWLWGAGMAAMLVILVIGHVQFDLGLAQTAKSAAGWAKGWALLALFPIAGFALPIRLNVVTRALCRLARQSLFLLPLFLIAPFLHLPMLLWVSPLKHLGGASDEFFAAYLYTLEPGAGTPRWQFFAPWSPAAGMVALVHFLIVRNEPDARWRWTGYAACIAIALLSTSRLALVALIVIAPLAWGIARLGRGTTWLALAPVLVVAPWFALQAPEWIADAQSGFDGARAASSRVRATLGRLALQRWQDDGYWFGHGMVERGPHLVEYMPIGSHHSWYGLLFVKGLTGAVALAVPMMASLVAATMLAIRGGPGSRVGQLGLALVLVFWLYSFGENLEVLIYLTWPAMLVFGIVLRDAAGQSWTNKALSTSAEGAGSGIFRPHPTCPHPA